MNNDIVNEKYELSPLGNKLVGDGIFQKQFNFNQSLGGSIYGMEIIIFLGLVF